MDQRGAPVLCCEGLRRAAICQEALFYTSVTASQTKKKIEAGVLLGPLCLSASVVLGPLYLFALCSFGWAVHYPLSSSLIRGNNYTSINKIGMLRHYLAVH